MVLHYQAAPAQEAALTELRRETIQTVSLHFQMRQLRKLADFFRNGCDTVVAKTQALKFAALKQLFWNDLNFIPVNYKMLEVL